MKTLLFILSFTFLFSFNVYSQVDYPSDNPTTELLVYIPIRTYHYDRSPDYEYAKDEGGNLGAILNYRRISNKWIRDISGGALRNSYGKLSFTSQFGVGRRIGKFDTSINLGLISGYKILFEDEIVMTTGTIYYYDHKYEFDLEHVTPNRNYYQDILPQWMQDTGILPAVSVTVSYRSGLVSPMLVISPEYVNVGILVKF